MPKLLSLKKINYVYDNFHCTKIEAASRSRESNRRRERGRGELGSWVTSHVVLLVREVARRGDCACRLPSLSLPLLALMFS